MADDIGNMIGAVIGAIIGDKPMDVTVTARTELIGKKVLITVNVKEEVA